MKDISTDDAQIHSYLLEDIPEAEADAFERRLLADDDLFDLLEAYEDELLAAASRGELATAEKERVLRRLAASPRGRERLALARSLNAEADRLAEAAASPRVLPFPRRLVPSRAAWSGLAAAAALLLAVGLWFARSWFTVDAPAPEIAQQQPGPVGLHPAPSTEPAPQIAETPTRGETPPVIAQSEKEPQGAGERRQPIVRETLILSLATLRSAGGKEEVRVPAGKDLVEIQLVDFEGLEEDLGHYDIAVRNTENEVVWEREHLAPKPVDWGDGLEGTALVLEIPAERLPSGGYKVTVSAGTESLELDFDVVREGH
jgi:hypothetical protein